MKQLTETQLNAKIDAFLKSRYEDHPDILAMETFPEMRLTKDSFKALFQGLFTKTSTKSLHQGS